VSVVCNVQLTKVITVFPVISGWLQQELVDVLRVWLTIWKATSDLLFFTR